MLYDITVKLHEILNELYPKLGCGFFTDEEEALLQLTFDSIKEVNTRNHKYLFPIVEAEVVK